MDGSLVSPFFLKGNRVAWGSKMGLTGISQNIKIFAESPNHKPNYIRFAEKWLSQGKTPLFEYFHPTHKVIIDYHVEKLSLLSIRDNETGDYMSYPHLKEAAKEFNIPYIQEFAKMSDYKNFSIRDFAKSVLDLEKNSVEGCVIQFE